MKCPRCDSDEVRVMVKAPVGDAWEVYVCDVCNFSWRSTEKIEVDDIFRIDPGQIGSMGVIPPVPGLVKK